MNQTSPKRAFSLLELLMVISVIAILVALLIPSLTVLKRKASSNTCKGNLKVLSRGYIDYVQGRGGKLVGSNTRGGNSSPNGEPNWVIGRQPVKNGALFTGITDRDIYKCPDHLYSHYDNSYSLNGRLNGEHGNFATGSGFQHFSAIPNPGQTFMMVEENDPRGYNINSFIIANRNRWVDRVAGNHDKGDNVAFADGHVEYWKYQQPERTLDGSGFYAQQPGNPDLFRYWQNYGWRVGKEPVP